jgi:hypothetical protein
MHMSHNPVDAAGTSPEIARVAGRDDSFAMPVLRYRVAIFAICALAFGVMAALRVFGFSNLYQRIFDLWGVVVGFPRYIPFEDTRVVLAAIQCHREGLNVFETNPCDVLGRLHIYSPIWLAFSPLGLGNADVPWIGTAMGLGFLLACAAISNPTTLRETGLYLLALFSQSIALALERGNFDMLMFILVAASCWFFVRGPAGRAVAYVTIYGAAILKFYPLVAYGIALAEKPGRMVAVALGVAFAWALFFFFDWHDLSRLWLLAPHTDPLNDAFGSVNFAQATAHLAGRLAPNQRARFDVLAVYLHGAMAIAAVIVSVALARRMIAAGFRVRSTSVSDFLFLCGGLITLFAFFTTQNPPYRAMWLLPLMPMLLERRRASASVSARAWLAGGLAVLILLLWLEFLHTRIGLLTRSAAAQDLFAYAVREPLWWASVVAIMALLWVQLAGMRTPRSLWPRLATAR